jgi:N-acetylmuramoyl-L-alanine amidase
MLTLCCGKNEQPSAPSTISINPNDYPWLKAKKIFVDAGHGGTAATDKFRNGPHGVTEESVNLQVALFLEGMLKQAGADAIMSRRADVDISLDERCRMVEETQPDILVSVHHNGTIHAADGVNYTCVLVRGSLETFPASYDLAVYLKDELAKVIEAPALVVSDHSVFQETGTRILRNTAPVCPGVIGEGGFFSDPEQALLMTDPKYNEKEAMAYFNAIAAYLKGGIPTGQIYFACPIWKGVIRNRTPFVFLKADPGQKNTDIKEDSIVITLDDVPLTVTKWRRNIFRINYGRVLYPGGHRFRFYFRNSSNNSSMVLCSSFISDVERGDYANLIYNGRKQLNWGNVSEGLKMLLSANSMEATGPEGRKLIKDIADGFMKLGLSDTAEYYNLALHHFHPADEKKGKKARNVSWYPIRYYGKQIPIVFGLTP